MEMIFQLENQTSKNKQNDRGITTAEVIESSERIAKDWFIKGIPKEPPKKEGSEDNKDEKQKK